MREMPSIGASAHSHSTYGLGMAGGFVNLSGTSDNSGSWQSGLAGNWQDDREVQRMKYIALANMSPTITKENTPVANINKRRLVQVLIADANENVPLEQCLLYRGEPKLTDATDQELFFEIDIKNILDKHNAERVKLIDKKVKERTEHLEPAKIRDLKMVVVTIAAF